MTIAIGIDFGTAFCRAAVLNGDRAETLALPGGENALPCWVAADRSGQPVVGRAAWPERYAPSRLPVTGVKSLFGVQEQVWLGSAMHPVDEVAAWLLATLRRQAGQRLGADVRGVVIGVPAHYGQRPRTITRQAAQRAGFTAIKLINETTAAALEYCQRMPGDRRLLVVSLGAGVFQVSALEVRGTQMRNLASAGRDQAGGTAFDRVLTTYLLKQVYQHTGADLSTSSQALWVVGNLAARARIELDLAQQVELPLGELETAPGKKLTGTLTLTRPELEFLLQPLLAENLAAAQPALERAGWAAGEVDEILLLGGAARQPLVQQMLADHWGRTPIPGDDDLIALGTALDLPNLSEAPAAVIEPVQEITTSRLTPVPQLQPEIAEVANFLSRGQPERALDLLDRLCRRGSNHPIQIAQWVEAFKVAGKQLAQKHKFEQAIAAFRAGLAYSPGHPKISQYLWDVYYYQERQALIGKHPGSAMHILEQAKRDLPHLPAVRQELTNLQIALMQTRSASADLPTQPRGTNSQTSDSRQRHKKRN